MRPDEAPVLVFDGVCVLCSRWVRFVLRHDRGQRVRFAAMQSVSGRALLSAHGLDPDDPTSFLLLQGGRAYQQTDAILRLLAGFGGAWRATAALRLLPAALRDALYRTVARNRYRWFGRNDTCLVPSADVRERFLQ